MRKIKKNNYLNKNTPNLENNNHKILKIAILLSIAILLINISSVSATDFTIDVSNETGVNGAISTVEIENDSDNVITLEAGTYNKATDRNNKLTFSNKNLLIQGNGAPNTVVIHGNNSGSLFNITGGNNNITFQNITFSNAKITGNGSAMYIGSTNNVNLINCIFTNNVALHVKGLVVGGAIYNNGGNLYIANSTFTSNIADSTLTDDLVARSYGGAIYNKGGSLRLENSIFTNNSARSGVKYTNVESYGGAIYNTANNLNISNCNFTNNSANITLNSAYEYLVYTYGGAIYNTGANLSINNSIFTSNIALSSGNTFDSYSYGGAVYNTGINLNVNNSKFTNNSAKSPVVTASAYSYGGVIYNQGANFNISNSDFTTNIANSTATSTDVMARYVYTYGGAIYNNVDNLTIVNSRFTNSMGYGVFTHKSSRVDTAYSYGGAIYNTGINLNINDSTFTRGYAYTQSGSGNAYSYGAAIYTTNNNFNLVNSSFSNNTVYSYTANTSRAANSFGGAVYSGGNNFNINTSTFVNNILTSSAPSGTATSRGGALYISGSGVLNHNRLYNNPSTQLYVASGTVDADYNWWGNNSPTVDGTILNNYHVLTMENLTIDLETGTGTFDYLFYLNTNEEHDVNLIPYFGGRVYINTTTATIAMNLTFDGNDTKANGTWDARFNNTVDFDFDGVGIANKNVTFKLIVDGVTQSLSLFAGQMITITKVNSQNGTYGDKILIVANLTNQSYQPVPSKTIKFYINKSNDLVYMGSNITNGEGIANLEYIINGTGNCTIFAVFEGTGLYTNSNSTTKLTFSPQTSALTVSNIAVTFNQSVALNATLTDSSNNSIVNKSVGFYVDGEYIGSNVTDDSGIAVYYYALNNTGNFTYYGTFVDSEGNYESVNSTESSVVVNQAQSMLNVFNVTATFNQSVALSTILTESANDSIVNKSVGFYVDGEYIGSNITDDSGIAVYYYTPDNASNFTYYVVFVDSEGNYESSNSTNITITVNQAQTILVVNNTIATFNQSATLSTTLKDINNESIVNKSVGFYVDGEYIGSNVTDDSGIAVYYYVPSNASNFTYYVVFVDSEGNYESSNSTNITITVNQAQTILVVNNTIATFNQSATLSTTLKDINNESIVNKSVGFYVDGEYIGSNVTDDSGIAVYYYIPNNASNFTYYSIFIDSEGNYESVNSTEGIVVVNQAQIILVVNNTMATFNQSAALSTTLKDDNNISIVNKSVDFYVNGGYIGSNVTDDSGIAVYYYTPSNANNFTYHTAFVDSEGNYESLNSTDATVVVNQAQSILNVLNVTAIFNQSVALGITLTDSGDNSIVNKSVGFYVNGEYIGSNITDDSGIAVYYYTPNNASNFTYYVVFVDSEGNYESSNSTNITITVNQAQTILVVNNTIATFDQSATLSTTLKDINNESIVNKFVGFYVNGEYIGSNVTDDSGIAVYYYVPSNASNFTYYAVFVDSEGNYGSVNSTDATVVVNQAQSMLDVLNVTAIFNQSVALSTILTDSADNSIVNKFVGFYVNGEYIGSNVTDDSGIAVYYYVPSNASNFTYYAVFVDSEGNYGSVNSTDATVVVNQAQSMLDVLNVTAIFNQSVALSTILTDSADNSIVNKSVGFYVNGEYIGSNVTDDSGIAVYYYVPSNASNFTYYGAFIDSEGNYGPSESENITVVVNLAQTVLMINNTSSTFDQPVALTTTLVDSNNESIVNKFVDFYVNGEYIGSNVTDGDGTSVYYYAPTNIGNFTYYVVFVDSEGNYESVNSTDGIFVVNQVQSMLSVFNVTATFNQSIDLSAILINSNNEFIVNKFIGFYVNGEYIGSNVTDDSGIAVYYYTPNSTNSFIYHTSFIDSEGFYGMSNSTIKNVTVNKISTIITAFNLTATVNQTVILYTILKNDKNQSIVNKTIKFYVNEQYIGSNTTNNNGTAIYYYVPLSVDYLTYFTSFISFEGSYGNSNSTEAKITVTEVNQNSTDSITVDTNYTAPPLNDQNITAPLVKGNDSTTPQVKDNSSIDSQILGENINKTQVGNQNSTKPQVENQNISKPQVGNQNSTKPQVEDQNISKPQVENQELEEESIVKPNKQPIVNSTTPIKHLTVKKVSKTKTKIKLSVIISKYYIGSKTTVSVKAQNTKGKYLSKKVFTAYLNGKKLGEYTTNSKGQFKIKTLLKKSKNRLTIKYAGDSQYHKLNKTYSVKAKSKTAIKIYPIKAKKGSIVKLKSRLTSSNGVPLVNKHIKFYVKGEYVGKAKTNKKGIAILKYKI
ncbi:beta strand repeat-containing protein [Methanobrevibacter filiformis]|uniref:Uncharacterized protein n=1 Tax=Methanobrevibacter filiformis TaxID=55758 RepID=A0A166F0Y3_9EURY|nr:Ig-like domain-containing protein [Methanobrevibacter filiformis]KZX17210.1 hypothetical protein MBFIL_02800 [Methanobrevibacter filiformis]